MKLIMGFMADVVLIGLLIYFLYPKKQDNNKL